MLINNLLLRSIIKDFNIKLTQTAVENYYSQALNYSASELNSFLSQDLPLFWQEYLIPLLIYPVWGLSILVSATYLVSQNLLLGLLFSVGGGLMVIPQFVFNKQLQTAGENFSKARETSLKRMTDFSKGVLTIRSNQAGEDFSKKLIDDVEAAETAQYKFYTSHNIVMFWTGPLKGLGMIVPFVIGLLLLNSSGMSLTTLIAMMTASTNFISPLQQLLEASASLQSTSPLRKKILSVLSLRNLKTNECQARPMNEIPTIQVEQLTKKFSDKLLFNNLTFQAKPGQHLLLTGSSGSGKSSFFKILTGEDSDFSGEAKLIDSSKQVYQPSYSTISLIHQNPYLFNDTLRNNLTLFQDYSDSELEKVLKKVHLWDEIPEKLDYRLNGNNLSGGQAMKLEIARSLLRQKPILLADEITSSLDSENAKEIHQLLKKLPATIIEIAHKYQIEDYDVHYHLQNHQLVEQ
ncbi:ABC transporter ATP-binding/membrane spanning protein - multidrug resistance [Streptococcus sp. DD11]|nr:ABC transporter ATP-binding/membrane spanning protein - multidrug resistance [Streptococcus sp. DD11]